MELKIQDIQKKGFESIKDAKQYFLEKGYRVHHDTTSRVLTVQTLDKEEIAAEDIKETYP